MACVQYRTHSGMGVSYQVRGEDRGTGRRELSEGLEEEGGS